MNSKKNKRTRENILSFYNYKVEKGYLGGQKIVGSNHGTDMNPREIANRVKKDFKELYPDFTLSIKYSSYTGGSDRRGTITAAPEKMFVPLEEFDPGKIFIDITINNRYYRRFEEIQQFESKELCEKIKKEIYYNFIMDTQQNVRATDSFYTKEMSQAIQDLYLMLRSFEYSDCNGMVDYFCAYDSATVYTASTLAIEKQKAFEKVKSYEERQEYRNKYPNLQTRIKKILENI